MRTVSQGINFAVARKGNDVEEAYHHSRLRRFEEDLDILECCLPTSFFLVRLFLQMPTASCSSDSLLPDLFFVLIFFICLQRSTMHDPSLSQN